MTKWELFAAFATGGEVQLLDLERRAMIWGRVQAVRRDDGEAGPWAGPPRRFRVDLIVVKTVDGDDAGHGLRPEDLADGILIVTDD